MAFAKMWDTARATSCAVTLNKVVVGSASRRRSGDIEIAALASLIVAIPQMFNIWSEYRTG